MNRRNAYHLLGMAAIVIALSISRPAGAAITKGANFTNAAAAEQQRLEMFDQAERSFQQQLRVGRQRYEQKQANRAKVIEAMNSQLQNRQNEVMVGPASMPEAGTHSAQKRRLDRSLLAAAALAVVLIGGEFYRRRQRFVTIPDAEEPTLSESLPNSAEVPLEDEIFYCKASGVNGCGRYSTEGFWVIKGSTGCRAIASIDEVETLRAKLIDDGVLREEGDTVLFEHDHLFISPSMAANALLGRAVNGWVEWKTQDGKTLDTMHRVEAFKKYAAPGGG